MPDIWITPRVWLAGERVTATKMNEISNDLRVLFPHTTGGDTAYRDPAGAYLTRLAKGSAFQSYRMKSDATIPEWGGYMAGKVIRAATQTIATGTPTNIIFSSIPISQGGFTWSAGDPTKLTLGMTGAFLIGVYFVMEGGSGYREADVILNGSTLQISHRTFANSTSSVVSVYTSPPLLFTSGDYLQLSVLHDYGGNRDLTVAHLSATFIGP